MLTREGTGLHDFGYWGLATDGFKVITPKDWENDRERLVAYVIQVIEQLRQGRFEIDSRKDDCTQRCDYSAVCRVKQVRAAGKVRDDVPRLELKL